MVSPGCKSFALIPASKSPTSPASLTEPHPFSSTISLPDSSSDSLPDSDSDPVSSASSSSIICKTTDVQDVSTSQNCFDGQRHAFQVHQGARCRRAQAKIVLRHKGMRFRYIRIGGDGVLRQKLF